MVGLQSTGEWRVLPSMCSVARSTDVRKGKGALVDTAFNNFKKMYDVCDTHASREYHKDAVAACEAFVQVISGRQESVGERE